MDKSRYESSVIEFEANFVSKQIANSIMLEHATRFTVQSHDLVDSFEDAIAKLYDVKYGKEGDFKYIKDENYEKFEADEYNYRQLSTEELFLANYVKILEDYDIDYSDINLKDTNFYKVFDAFIDEDAKNVRYADYKNGNYNISFGDVEERVNSYAEMIESSNFEQSRLNAFVPQVASVLRYSKEDYSAEEITLMMEFLEKYAPMMEEEYQLSYGTRGFEEDLEELENYISTLSNTVEQNTNTEEMDNE